MKAITYVILVALIASCRAKPTFDVLANILHDIVHDPNEPHDHRDPYAQNGPYGYGNGYQTGTRYQTVNGYQQYPNEKAYNQGSYTQGGGNAYYPNDQYYQGSYPNGGRGQNGYGSNQVYDAQGHYQGPPYRQNNNGYGNYGYQSPPQNSYRNRGY